MKNNLKIAILAAMAVILGEFSTIAQKSSASGSEQLISMCPGGGYPVWVCEIVNGKKVCVRRCPDNQIKQG
jgi:hypothetical protein